MRYLLLILALLAFISPAKAQSSKAEKAIECSAVYLIATAAYGTNKQAANAFMSIQRMFDGVFSANEKQRTNRVITNGMMLHLFQYAELRISSTGVVIVTPTPCL